MFKYLAPLVASGAISTPVRQTHDFDQAADAIAKPAQSGARNPFTPIGMER
jgi:hypothetical protein